MVIFMCVYIIHLHLFPCCGVMFFICINLHAAELFMFMLQSTEDWIQDFKQFLSDAPYSSVLENMYPEAQVHHGFLEQLQAVTDKAPNSSQNIGDVLMDMSGGVTPSLVIVTGWTMVLTVGSSSVSAF